MSHNSVTMLTPEERDVFKEYLRIHRISEGKSILEVVASAMTQAFLGIQESEIKSQSSGPFPPKWVR